MGYHVQVIVDDKYLKEYWGIEKGSIRLVVKKKEYKNGAVYQVKAIERGDNNHKGKIVLIWLKDFEVKIKILKHSNDVDI